MELKKNDKEGYAIILNNLEMSMVQTKVYFLLMSHVSCCLLGRLTPSGTLADGNSIFSHASRSLKE